MKSSGRNAVVALEAITATDKKSAARFLCLSVVCCASFDRFTPFRGTPIVDPLCRRLGRVAGNILRLAPIRLKFSDRSRAQIVVMKACAPGLVPRHL